jgi:5'-3' exoribonuclease 2
LVITFEKDEPFKPLEQLMCLLPAASKSFIPESFHHLMTNDESPIIDFFPEEFPIDLCGKRFIWQGVALLPFIDSNRLLKELVPLYNRLTEQEKKRNSFGTVKLFVHCEHESFIDLSLLYQENSEHVICC